MTSESDVRVQMFARTPGTERPRDDAPVRILVVGDFSGRASRGVCEPLRGRRARRVDRDDVEDVLAALSPAVDAHTREGAPATRIEPRSLDDLHPDRLWSELETFERLRSLRRRLANPDTFAAAAAEVRGAGQAATAPASDTRNESDDPPVGGSLLEATLRATDETGGGGTGSEIVDALLRELVIPTIPATPGQDELLASVDRAAEEEMRALLHAPALRRLEADWRALELLTRRIETDARLSLWIVDASAEELVRDVVPHTDPRASETWKALFEPDADGAPRWAAWTALDLAFGGTAKQAALLSRFAALAAAASAPLLAAASPTLAGCPSFGEAPDPDDWGALDDDAGRAWSAVRGLADAAWVSLAAPRLLLRAPYGPTSSPVEAFRFEELVGKDDHERFLWGSGAVAAVLVLARELGARGWSFSPDGVWELDRLPIPAYVEDGESVVMPPSEVVFGERANDRLCAAGITPLVAVRGADRVRLGPLASIAGTPLAGRWFA